MKYDRHSTFKCRNDKPIDFNKTKPHNPPKQGGDNKRLCETVGRGKETENKLLVQISEAEQVSDFERILNCNAILYERAHGHVWRRSPSSAPSAAVAPRPRSAYSLRTVSRAYHYLFQRHQDALQPLVDSYRQETDKEKEDIPDSLLDKNWYENLHDLSEFYEEDQDLQKEIQTITDQIISEELETSEEKATPSKNFNVNLADLIGLRVNCEGYSPVSVGVSPDVDKQLADEGEEEKEWLSPIMNADSDDSGQDKDHSVECLAQNLGSVKIDSDANVPTITFSNCCDGCASSNLPANPSVVIHLAVPSIDSADEVRPPMM